MGDECNPVGVLLTRTSKRTAAAFAVDDIVFCRKAKFDGDLVLVFDDDAVLAGVDRRATPVIDIDDKITTEPEEFTPENKLKVILRTMKNLIGEYSNYATAFQNKCPRTEEQREKYKKCIDVISVLTGKSIDYAKTGILYPMPRSISKYGRPLPYFMKYASPYYARQSLSKTQSNMNRLCYDLERWEKRLRWARRKRGFDWHLMIDDSVEVDNKTYEKVEEIYGRFVLDVKELSARLANGHYTPEERSEQYGECYELYRSECRLVCPNKKKLANIVVTLAYQDHKSWNRKFIWIVAGAGIVDNITQVDIRLPERSQTGRYEYLGRRYDMALVPADSEILKECMK